MSTTPLVSTSAANIAADYLRQKMNLVEVPQAQTPVRAFETALTPQPDAIGEFATPLDGALFMALVHGKRQTPLQGKAAFLPNWQGNASTDPTIIRKWAAEYPGCNFGSIADDGPIFETDSSEVRKRFAGQFSQTLTIQSSENKGHRYYLPADVEHIAQNAVKYGDFSLRKHNAYCVSPGSIHPTTGKQYRVAINVPMVVPTAVEIDFWKSERIEKKSAAVSAEEPIPSGKRNSTITSILGNARQNTGAEYGVLLALARQINDRRCQPPLAESELETTAASIARYAVKTAGPVVLGGKIAGSAPATQAATASPEIVLPEFKPAAYPKFPDPAWLFKGCSIYEGLVKPVCAANPSRRPEFMMLPAMTVLLNYAGTKVRILDKNLIPSIFMVSIARKGRLFKSACVQDAIDYLNVAGVVSYAHGGTRNSEGKSLVWTAGSPEGLGLEMSRTTCKNAVLFYDELGTLSKKASFDSSTLGQALCTLYESGMFANQVKNRKESFAIQPQSYCASVIACTTDRNFLSKMSPLISSADGVDERFFYLYQPEMLPEPVPYTYINTVGATMETGKRMGKAVQQGVYQITGDMTELEHLAKLNNRAEVRAEKWALFFAIDLGKDEIDDECLEKAYALATYELAVKKYLAVPEATTREGAIQSEVISHLSRSGGKMLMRDLYKKMHPERHGTSLWSAVYVGLTKNNWIAEQGTGAKNDPKYVVLLRAPESDEE